MGLLQKKSVLLHFLLGKKKMHMCLHAIKKSLKKIKTLKIVIDPRG